VLGHRLVAFLTRALPKHPEYMRRSVSKYRNETFRDLVWINARMEEIALRIDEEQLNIYISHEYDPEPPDEYDDDDESNNSTAASTTASSSSGSGGDGEPRLWGFLRDDDDDENRGRGQKHRHQHQQWESFQNWPFDISSPPFSDSSDNNDRSPPPLLTDTDTSMSSSEQLNASRDLGVESDDSNVVEEFDGSLFRCSNSSRSNNNDGSETAVLPPDAADADASSSSSSSNQFPRLYEQLSSLHGGHRRDAFLEDDGDDDSAAPDFFEEDEEDDSIDEEILEAEAYRYHDDDAREYEDYDDEEEDGDYYHEHSSSYSFADALQVSAFLRKIADEDVRYESDSEADDSWAQEADEDDCYDDDNCGGTTGSVEVLTCDPARIVFHESLNRNPESSPSPLSQAIPPPPPPPPQPAYIQLDRTTTPPLLSRRELTNDREIGEQPSSPPPETSWASFDFATVRRAS